MMSSWPQLCTPCSGPTPRGDHRVRIRPPRSGAPGNPLQRRERTSGGSNHSGIARSGYICPARMRSRLMGSASGNFAQTCTISRGCPRDSPPAWTKCNDEGGAKVAQSNPMNRPPAAISPSRSTMSEKGRSVANEGIKATHLHTYGPGIQVPSVAELPRRVGQQLETESSKHARLRRRHEVRTSRRICPAPPSRRQSRVGCWLDRGVGSRSRRNGAECAGAGASPTESGARSVRGAAGRVGCGGALWSRQELSIVAKLRSLQLHNVESRKVQTLARQHLRQCMTGHSTVSSSCRTKMNDVSRSPAGPTNDLSNT